MAATKRTRRQQPGTSTGNTNSSYIGALVRVDPEDAAKKILAAHKKTGGNSTSAAKALGITYPHLLTLVARVSAPIADPKHDGETRKILLASKRGEEPRATLRELIDELRDQSTEKEDASVAPEALREGLDQALARGARLTAIASAVKVGDKTLDLSLLSKFRQGHRGLGLDVRKKLRRVLDGLGEAQPTQGRRAAPRATGEAST